jgi:cellulose synthase/poly-beta-1,6-N-acetylglucosamine synthase-like glycosyltransferase
MHWRLLKMKSVLLINMIVGVVFFVCYFYQFVYVAVPFVRKHRSASPKTVKLHRYAVLISARNEEVVIANLINSIKHQTYPGELVTTFVVADNCTDKTAKVAEAAGAVVYVRNNKELVGKGYALDYLLGKIRQDFPEGFDGYFVFDADNVLDVNYIAEMNKTFCQGYKIMTSYRNSKNYGDNWITAGYGLWFLRESVYLNGARMLMGTSCAVSGTGFMFSREIMEKCGWKFFLLTEDIQFSVSSVIDGEKIGYCAKAMLYDEQPVTFKQSWNQRLRWAKGYYQVFGRYGAKLIKGMFKGNFSCYDMAMSIMPAIILTGITVVVDFGAMIYMLSTGQSIVPILEIFGTVLLNMYLLMFTLGAITTFTQWKRIYTTNVKKVLYMFTFPIFMLTYIPISITAFVKKVQWTPIAHTKASTVQEITGEKTA